MSIDDMKIEPKSIETLLGELDSPLLLDSTLLEREVWLRQAIASAILWAADNCAQQKATELHSPQELIGYDKATDDYHASLVSLANKISE